MCAGSASTITRRWPKITRDLLQHWARPDRGAPVVLLPARGGRDDPVPVRVPHLEDEAPAVQTSPERRRSGAAARGRPAIVQSRHARSSSHALIDPSPEDQHRSAPAHGGEDGHRQRQDGRHVHADLLGVLQPGPERGERVLPERRADLLPEPDGEGTVAGAAAGASRTTTTSSSTSCR